MFRKITTFAVVAACGAIALSFTNDAYARDGGGPPPFVYEKMREQQRIREQRPAPSVERDATNTAKPTKRLKRKRTLCRTAGGCYNPTGR